MITKAPYLKINTQIKVHYGILDEADQMICEVKGSLSVMGQ
jgi:hypothetical protein